jgi:hypothetical protein
MADLEFLFREMLEEIQSMSHIASDFLTPETQEIAIRNIATDLENIRNARPRVPKRWAAAAAQPLRTVDSAGEYEHGQRQGAHTVFGEITFVWQVFCPLEPGPRGRAQNKFTLSGLSSTKVQILERMNGGQRELATWRFEVGDDAHPGCHFHTQIEGDRAEPPYPRSLPVPRLPTVLVTPMAALEFLLAEIFQSSWKRHAARDTAEMQRWRPIQKGRLKSLFEWQIKCIDESVGSPWTAFKAQKPPSDLFVRAR